RIDAGPRRRGLRCGERHAVWLATLKIIETRELPPRRAGLRVVIADRRGSGGRRRCGKRTGRGEDKERGNGGELVNDVIWSDEYFRLRRALRRWRQLDRYPRIDDEFDIFDLDVE